MHFIVGITSMMFICLLGLTLLATVQSASIQDVVEQRVVKRQNFGTIFFKVQEIYVVSEFYNHHLVFEMPPNNLTMSSLVANAHPNEINKRFEEWMANVNTPSILATTMRQEILQLQKVMDAIYDLFPEVDLSRLGSRKQRSWCIDICWGLASLDDLNLIERHIKQNDATRARNFDKIQKSVDAMSSYARVTESKFEALKYITQRLQNASAFADKAIKNAQLLMASVMNVYLPSLIQLHDLYQSLILLKHDILTFQILSFEQAKVIFQQIQQHVASEWPMRSLVHSDPLSLYRSTDLSYFRTNSSLHIAMV